MFYGISDAYCEANNLDVSRETNAGRGPVDFKFSRGYKSRVLVETKLTTNPQLLHGFETQLEEYQKAEKTLESIYLVINVVGSSQSRIFKLKKLINEGKKSNLRLPIVIFIDALPKPSASKYKKRI